VLGNGYQLVLNHEKRMKIFLASQHLRFRYWAKMPMEIF
jgi:hypothetical protein